MLIVLVASTLSSAYFDGSTGAGLVAVSDIIMAVRLKHRNVWVAKERRDSREAKQTEPEVARIENVVK
jgi:hypothetical protein